MPLVQGRSPSVRSAEIAELEDHVGFGIGNTPEMRSLINESWHYITAGGAPDQLYAYRTDAAEERNLAETPAGIEAIAHLTAELRATTSPEPYRLRPKPLQ